MHETFQIAAWSIAILLGILWTVIGLLLGGLGWVLLRQWFSSVRWSQIPVTIVAGDVRTIHRPNGPDQFQPVVTYAVAADGRSPESEPLLFVGRAYSTEAQARQLIERYPVGRATTARRNPHYPAETVLERRGGLSGLLLLLLGLILVAVPLAAVYGVGFPVWPLVAILVTGAVVTLVLDSNNRRWLQQARRSGRYPAPGRGSDQDVERLVREGEKMLAVYLYRELHGTDLKSARMQVEALAARLDQVKSQ